MFSYRLIEENPGKDIIYFRNTLENAVLKQVNDIGIFVKFKGEEEFLARSGSTVVLDAIIECNIDYIDEETYNNW